MNVEKGRPVRLLQSSREMMTVALEQNDRIGQNSWCSGYMEARAAELKQECEKGASSDCCVDS